MVDDQPRRLSDFGMRVLDFAAETGRNAGDIIRLCRRRGFPLVNAQGRHGHKCFAISWDSRQQLLDYYHKHPGRRTATGAPINTTISDNQALRCQDHQNLATP